MIVGMRMKGWFERRDDRGWMVVCWLCGSVVDVLVWVVFWRFCLGQWRAYIACDGDSLVDPW